jgi:hypothetical protein
MGGVGVPARAVRKLGEGGVEDGGTLGGFEKVARAKRRPGGRGGRETGREPRHIGAGEGDGGKREQSKAGGARGHGVSVEVWAAPATPHWVAAPELARVFTVEA